MRFVTGFALVFALVSLFTITVASRAAKQVEHQFATINRALEEAMR